MLSLVKFFSSISLFSVVVMLTATCDTQPGISNTNVVSNSNVNTSNLANTNTNISNSNSTGAVTVSGPAGGVTSRR